MIESTPARRACSLAASATAYAPSTPTPEPRRLVARRMLATLLGALACVAPSSAARADGWQVGAVLGDDAWVSGGFGQHGFALLDARRDGVARGRLHFLYNTDTLQAGLENIRLADGKLEISIVARGEALLAGLLFDYYQRGERNTDRAFHASYVQLLPSLKWHPANRHSIELVAGMRQWFFGRMGSTETGFTLPPDTFVFEPRLNYTYWRIRARSTEWESHRLHPRIEGVAFGAGLGVDRRTDRRAWGATIDGQLDTRNNPGDVILTARQWLYAGVATSPLTRLQFEEHASWGAGEDDITRNRVGGMNPYVIPIAGLPWAVALSERLATARVALHVKPRASSPHELGVGVDGAVFSDPRRTGALRQFGGAGGSYGFADLRFGRFQLHGRVGYGFPTPWLATRPNVSALFAVGVRIR